MVSQSIKNLSKNTSNLEYIAFEQELAKFKTELESEIKSAQEIIEKRILNLEINSKKDNLETNEGIYDKIDELVEKFNKLTDLTDSDIQTKTKELTEKIQKEIDRKKQILSEVISQEILSKNNFLDEIKKQINQKLISIDSEIENKFSNTKTTFEKEIIKMLDNFDKFKTKSDELILSHLENLNHELHLVKQASTNIDHERQTILDEVQYNLKSKENEIQSNVEKKTSKILEEKFNKKLENINLFEEKLKSKEEELDKKITYFENSQELFFSEIKNEKQKQNTKIDEKIKEFETEKENIIQTLNQEQEEINNRVENILNVLEIKENSLEEKIKNSENIFSQKIEHLIEKLNENQNDIFDEIDKNLTLNQQELNKKNLEIDENIINFKNSISTEVEHLIKDIEEILSKNMNQLNQEFTKFKNYGQKLNEGLAELNSIREKIDIDIDILKTKIEQKPTTQSNLNLIQNMSNYENQLLLTIKELKTKGLNENQIKETLKTKGHPIFYVTMIIENLPYIFK